MSIHHEVSVKTSHGSWPMNQSSLDKQSDSCQLNLGLSNFATKKQSLANNVSLTSRFTKMYYFLII